MVRNLLPLVLPHPDRHQANRQQLPHYHEIASVHYRYFHFDPGNVRQVKEPDNHPNQAPVPVESQHYKQSGEFAPEVYHRHLFFVRLSAGSYPLYFNYNFMSSALSGIVHKAATNTVKNGSVQ